MKILIVDDNDTDRMILSSYINPEQHQVYTADSGESAIASLEDTLPDLVLLDVSMTGLDGYETSIKLRERFHYNNWIPIIFISGNNDPEFIERAVASGGDDFLSKPVYKAVLNAKILAMERLWKIQKEMYEQKQLLSIANEKLLHVVEKLQNETMQRKEAELMVNLQLKRLEVTNEKLAKLRKQERYRALHDPLTDLPNRSLMVEYCKEEIYKSERNQCNFAFMILDLDGFKQINDNLGHEAGDKLLVEVSQRLRDSVRKMDLVCRLGGDEFSVMLTELSSPEDAGHVAKKIINEVKNTYVINNEVVAVTCSIGIALYPTHGKNYQDLSRQADIAMYAAKNKGKGCYIYFDEQLEKSVTKRMNYRAQLHEAIAEQNFKLVYQPVMNIENNAIDSVECFIRWQRDETHVELPERFIPFASSVGAIDDIDKWTVMHACEQAKKWTVHGHELILSLNVTSKQLLKPSFVEMCADLVEKNNLKFSQIRIELSEKDLEHDLPGIESQVHQLSDKGMQLVLDNFGTGLTSLRFLYDLPLSYLKVDAEFIDACRNDEKLESLVHSVINVTRSLDIEVVAGKVETEEQMRYLRDIGFNLMQGYYFHKPCSAHELEHLFGNTLSYQYIE